MTKTETPKAVPTVAATILRDAKERACGLRLAFANGNELIFTDDNVPSVDMAQELLWHGAKQKLVDAAAISRNPDTGRSATADDKEAAVRAVHARLLAGEWNKVREGSPTGGLLLRALVAMYDGRKTRDEVVAFLATKTDAEKAALRANPKVAAIIAELRDDAAKTDGIDTDAMLADLDA